jgi:hypothetical protein
MLNYLFAIFGLAALTALWVVFQLWLQKHDPDQKDRCVGCSNNCERKTAVLPDDTK